MRLKMKKLDVWAAEIEDRPGALARTLRAVADSGADLECVVARRQSDKQGRGAVFITPLESETAIEGATQAGLHRTTHVATLRIAGPDRPGFGADLARIIADTGVNLHGLTAMSWGRRFVCYASFDSVADLEKARDAISAFDAQMHRGWRELLTRKPAESVKVPA